MTSDPSGPESEQRWLQVLAIVAMSAALVGFIVETRRAPEAGGFNDEPPRAAAGEVPLAPTQGEMGSLRRAARVERHVAGLASLRGQIAPLAEGETATAEERRATVAERALRRAYDGAPPTVPHPVDQLDYPSCISCHLEGLMVAGRGAAVMSHEGLANCLQCHVVMSDPLPGRGDVAPDFTGSFSPLESAGVGTTAWAGAPPTIPHPTNMRERCDSCHGALGEGLRTSHGGRQSCTQCHGLSSTLDQRPLMDLPSLIP